MDEWGKCLSRADNEFGLLCSSLKKGQSFLCGSFHDGSEARNSCEIPFLVPSELLLVYDL